MKSVAVIGDVMVDVYEHVTATRVGQEAPVIVGEHERTEYRLGGAANVARNCKALGASQVLLYGVGSGDPLDQLIYDAGIQSMLLEGEFTRKQRFIDRSGQMLFRVDHDRTPKPDIRPVIKPYTDSLLVSDYDKGYVRYVDLKGVCAQVPFSVTNGKPKYLAEYRYANCLVFNRAEAIAALGRPVKDEDLAPSLLTQMLCMDGDRVTDIVVTNGAHGMFWATALGAGIASTTIPAEVVEIADVTGAGDTVAATIACHGRIDQDVLKEAARNAASVVRQHGTSVPL